MIVDDEKSFAEMIGLLMKEQLTSPVLTFTHPADALKQLPSLQPGIVVTDYYMPDMNGLDLIRAVQAIAPGTPCILITGHLFNLDDYSLDNLKSLKAVLPKPFRWQQLADMIELHWVGDNPPSRRINPDTRSL